MLTRTAAAALVVMATAFALPAQAKRIVIKMGTAAPEGTPWASFAYKVRRYIHKGSKKKFRVKIYLGSILGDEKSMVRQCHAGTIQMIGVSTAAMAAFVPELQALEIPYLFPNHRVADRVLDALYDDIAALLEKKGFILAYISENGFRSMATTDPDNPIMKPSDLAGKPMRSQESYVHKTMYRTFGAKPNALPVTSVLEALQTGVVKGTDNTPLFMFATSWYQALKHFTLTRHTYQPAVVVYSKKFWDSVPEDLRKHLIPRRKKLTRWGRRRIRSLNKPLIANLRAAGLKIHKLSKGQRAVWRKAARSIRRKFREHIGADGRAFLDKILAKLK